MRFSHGLLYFTLISIINADVDSIHNGNSSLNWVFNAVVSISSTPALSSVGDMNEYVFFTTKTGYLLSLDRYSGDLLWSQETFNAASSSTKQSNPAIIRFDTPLPMNVTSYSDASLRKAKLRLHVPARSRARVSREGDIGLSKWAVVIGGIQMIDGITGASIWTRENDITATSHPAIARINGNLAVLIGDPEYFFRFY